MKVYGKKTVEDGVEVEVGDKELWRIGRRVGIKRTEAEDKEH
jgi:hypothetical protein